MQPRRRWIGLLCLSAALVAPPARAQSLCQAAETVSECLERLTAEIGGKAKADAAADASAKEQADVKKKTETALQDVNGLSSSVKDFLPLLQLAGALGGVKTDETTGAVSVALNTRFLGAGGKLTEDPSLQIKAVIETKPKLFDELRNKLPADKRDALEKQLLGGKPNAEHTTLHASYNFTSRRLGRNFARHMALYNDLFLQAVAPPTEAGVQAAAKLFRDLLDALGDNVDPDKTLWGEIPEANRTAAQTVLIKTARARRALQTTFTDAVKSAGLDIFGQLINNQPQLTITASQSLRDDLFGPDLFTGRIAYEIGLGNNLNGFFDAFDPRRCKAERAECLKEYSAYVNDPGTRANVKAASRLAVYAEFASHEAYRYANAAAGLDVTLPQGTVFSAGLDLGRLFGVSDTGAAEGRVDASVRYERRSDAPDKTRFVTSVTITKKLGDVSIPFGIVYANKPRFLTGVDKGLTANVGLKFNLFGAR